MDDFWAAIESQLAELRTAGSDRDVLRILAAPAGHNSPGFFAGSGGDGSVMESLFDAGWSLVWSEASYHYSMRAPDGSTITYVEGDIFGSDRSRSRG